MASGALYRLEAPLSRHGSRLTRPARARAQAQPGQQEGGRQEPAAGQALGRRLLLLQLAGAAAVAQAQAAPYDPACALTSTASGLQACDLKVGEGKEVAKGLIRCHYTGRLASNGAVFDSSLTRGRPFSFKVGAREVIAGWDQGILGVEGELPPMREGGKRRLVIPPGLGYGARGAGGVIPPNATLVFDVELLGRK